jgi:hypothetical protein
MINQLTESLDCLLDRHELWLLKLNLRWIQEMAMSPLKKFVMHLVLKNSMKNLTLSEFMTF